MYALLVLLFLSVSSFVPGKSTTEFADKSILRYGFQYAHDCQNFEKAFICIKKCQDLNYDSAFSDKHCKCTCYMKTELSKHKIKPNTTRDDWKSGAPTTKLPIWAQTTNTDDTTDDDDDDNESTTTNENTNETLKAEAPSEGSGNETIGEPADISSSSEPNPDNTSESDNKENHESTSPSSESDNNENPATTTTASAPEA